MFIELFVKDGFSSWVVIANFFDVIGFVIF